MAKLEKIFTVMLLIGVVLRFLQLDGADILTLLGGALLGILYWPLGFARLNGIRARDLFSGAAYRQRTGGALVLGAVLGLALAVTLFGAVFVLMRWAGGDVMRLVGGSTLLIILGIVVAVRGPLTLPNGGRGWLIRGTAVLLLALLAGYLPVARPTTPPAITR